MSSWTSPTHQMFPTMEELSISWYAGEFRHLPRKSRLSLEVFRPAEEIAADWVTCQDPFPFRSSGQGGRQFECDSAQSCMSWNHGAFNRCQQTCGRRQARSNETKVRRMKDKTRTNGAIIPAQQVLAYMHRRRVRRVQQKTN